MGRLPHGGGDHGAGAVQHPPPAGPARRTASTTASRTVTPTCRRSPAPEADIARACRAVHAARRPLLHELERACTTTGSSRSATWSRRSRASSFEPLPDVEPLEVVTSGAGKGSGGELQANYLRLLTSRQHPVAVPLRVPQPRVRRLPRLLRVLQAGLPRHLRPGDRQDGRRRRGRPVPPGRGAQAARPHGRATPASPTRSPSATSRPPARPCAPRARPARPGSPRSSSRPSRGSTSPPARASRARTRSGSRTSRSRSTSSRTTSTASRRATTSTARRRRSRAERDRIVRSTSPCSDPTRTARPSTASSASRAWSSRTSRTTTSTSSTGATR